MVDDPGFIFGFAFYAAGVIFFLYHGIRRNRGNTRAVLTIIAFALIWPVGLCFPSGKYEATSKDRAKKS